MYSLSYLSLLPLLLPLVAAHGHVTGIVVDGKWYTGWNAEMKYQNPIPPTAGWQADNLDNGFITPSDFAAANIICHKDAKNGNAYITAKAGSKVTFQWNTWPVSHKGPVFDYIAPCNGECTTVDKTSLQFTKFVQGAWISGNNPGSWVTDDLVKSNNSWTTTIPSGIAPGNYVIRHEIIALHAAGQTNGAQAYPQCVNFKIEGSGTQTLSGGAKATTFYKASDPGIKFDLYSKFTGYTIPGPALQTLKKRDEREHAREWVE
ncbi:lytic polysaccharide monooxygenase [Aaosphaeria arxii CBS 175.79]|uniref:Lytic polysaccharide monooxygenase n=1 Tax=Aaosphaeria arxii CBS 175.79 TaxID=1450172 RepID=A0A6A5XDQ5_9PLEO|nr:lytic polysaccharide monooxygenase [Aaosphaeria arxii CBS 175.79]KAF2011158.1 lytic polysaccharide monooxygenase [Aaosphaeria arxii CBS 175.79]